MITVDCGGSRVLNSSRQGSALDCDAPIIVVHDLKESISLVLIDNFVGALVSHVYEVILGAHGRKVKISADQRSSKVKLV